MRNLLMEFGANSDATRPCTLVGFREHIFTAGLTSLATFMGLQEGTQAALAEPGAPLHALPQHDAACAEADPSPLPPCPGSACRAAPRLASLQTINN